MLYITYYITAPTRIYKIKNIGKAVKPKEKYLETSYPGHTWT